MYLDHFGFNKFPFENSPDPNFFFMGRQYRETLALMIHCLRTRKGLMCISGSIGSGKTTLSRILLDHLPKGTTVISLVQPFTKTDRLLEMLCYNLEIETNGGRERSLVDTLRENLTQMNDEDRRCLLIIDEAQFMNNDQFKEVQLLTNFETSTAKLLQIMLLGQTELMNILDQVELRALSQRIAVMKVLAPMDLQQTVDYIHHRLNKAGSIDTIFTKAALENIFEISGGTPRVINKLSDAALLRAFIASKINVESKDVIFASKDLGLEFTTPGKKPQPKLQTFQPQLGRPQAHRVPSRSEKLKVLPRPAITPPPMKVEESHGRWKWLLMCILFIVILCGAALLFSIHNDIFTTTLQKASQIIFSMYSEYFGS